MFTQLFLVISMVLLWLPHTHCLITMYVTPQIYTIQQYTTYNFILDVESELIPNGSVISILFPSQYEVISSNTNYTCSIIDWPMTISIPLQCSIIHRTLTIINGFPVLFPNTSDIIKFQFSINGIKNPTYALSTNEFQGEINDGLGNLITQFSTFGGSITFTPGVLNVQMSVNPSIVNNNSTLTITITPSHSIPSTAYLSITNRQYWEKAVKTTASIISGSTSCISGQNTPNNLNCSITSASGNTLVNVYNVFTNTNFTNFTFNIANFLNPPTTQPQGSFSISIQALYLSTYYIIDQLTGIKVTSSIPQSILSPSITPSNYKVSTNNFITITGIINSFLSQTDTISIGVPKIIGLDSLQTITFMTIQYSIFSINSNNNTTNIITFTSGVQINPGTTITIRLTNLRNPSYVTTIPSFTITTLRNNFAIDNIANTSLLQYTTTSSNIICTINVDKAQVGQSSVTYTFKLTFETPLSISSIITILFPEQTQLNNSTLICLTNCNLTNTINTITITNAITTNNTSNLTIIIKNIQNGYKIGTSDTYFISSYDSSGNLIGQSNSTITITLIARQLSNVTLTSSSLMVNSITNLTFNIQNQNPIPSSSILQISLPSQLTLNSADCTPYCTSISNIISITLSQYPINSLPSIIIRNIINPTSTTPTSPINITIYDSSNNIMEYSFNTLTYKSQILALSTITLTRNSTTNSATFVEYSFIIRVPFSIGSTTSVLLGFDLYCQQCVVDSADSLRKYYSYPNLAVTYANGYSTVLLAVQSITNHYSYQPNIITAKLVITPHGYQIAYNTYTLINTQPNIITLPYSWTNTQFNSPSTLSISFNNSTNILSCQVTFPSYFQLSSIVCNAPYTCSVSSNTITASSNSSATLQISNIITPNITPSQSIFINTYTSNNYLMHLSTNIIWSTFCSPPCKTCFPLNTSSCLSCYSDPLLPFIQNNILLFNNTCVSICTDLYFANLTTNSCQLCSPNCYNCANYSICVSCISSKYLLNSSCYDSCPISYYGFNSSISSNICLPCSTSLHCEKCSDSLTCDSCISDYFYYSTKCLSSCPNITMGDIYLRKCVSCPTNCTNCDQNANYTSVWCTKCVYPSLLDNGGCYTTCQTFGTVSDGQKCISCDSKCFGCFNTIYQCLTCNRTSTHKYFLNNNCLSGCPDGYYANDALFICSKCTAPCEYCQNSLVSSCRSCISNFTLFGSSCNGTCPSYMFQNGSQVCQNCKSPCSTCISSTLCMSCVEGYYIRDAIGGCIDDCGVGYTGINGRCLACSANCVACRLVNYCTACLSTQFLLDGVCMSVCSNGYYPNTTTRVCDACAYSCAICSSSTVCSACVGGYQLAVNSSCESTCETGYVPVSGVCQPCSQNCTQCQISPDRCTKCKSNFYYAPYTCYTQCPSYLYTFSGNLSCLSECPSNYYSLNTSSTLLCLACESLCTQCTSLEVCSSCQEGTYFYNSKCYQSCPALVPYSHNNTCRACNIPNCYTCNSSLCSQCSTGLLLIDDMLCLSSCGDGNTYNFTTRKCISNSISSNTYNQINFVPLPYLMIALVGGVICLIVHFGYGYSVIRMILGLFHSLQLFIAVTTVVVAIVSKTPLNMGILVIVGVSGIVLLLNVIVFIYQWCTESIESPIGASTIIIQILSILVSFKTLLVLTANPQQPHTLIRWSNTSFLSIFNRFCMVSVLVDIGYIVGGIVLILLQRYDSYLFYSGIELVMISLLDAIISVMWLVGMQREVVPQLPQGSFEKIEEVSSQDDQQRISQYNSVRYSQPPHHHHKIEQRGYKSQYGKVIDTIKISVENIPEAIQKGIFRRNQQSLYKQQQQKLELSNLSSAYKMKQKQSKQQNEDMKLGSIDNNIIFENIQENIQTQSHQQSMSDTNTNNQSLGSQIKIHQSSHSKLIIEDYNDDQISNHQINIFDRYPSRIKKIHKNNQPQKNIVNDQEFQKKIIYADLQSIGTAQQNIDQITDQYVEKRQSSPNPYIFQFNEDLTKPSELFHRNKRQNNKRK